MNTELINDAAFMGKVTAGVTHELKNLLAIIKEYAGLMEDLMGLPACQGIPNRDRFVKALGSIMDQVQRGTNLLTHLNKFAHNADTEVSSVPLTDLVENLNALSERFLRQRAIALKLVAMEGANRPFGTSPIALQRLIFTILMEFARVLPHGTTLYLDIGTGPTVAYLKFRMDKITLGEAAKDLKRCLEGEGIKPLITKLSANITMDEKELTINIPTIS